LVSGSFHHPFGLLFSFPSRYLFAIGFGKYLRLDVSATHIPARKMTHGTQDTTPCSLKSYSNGAITLSGSAFQQIIIQQRGIKGGPNSTSIPLFKGKFGLPYTAFDRLYYSSGSGVPAGDIQLFARDSSIECKPRRQSGSATLSHCLLRMPTRKSGTKRVPGAATTQVDQCLRRRSAQTSQQVPCPCHAKQALRSRLCSPFQHDSALALREHCV
jgi:hypothetical protein